MIRFSTCPARHHLEFESFASLLFSTIFWSIGLSFPYHQNLLGIHSNYFFLSVSLCMRALELARQLSCVLLTYSKPRITLNTQELKLWESRFLNNIIVSLIWHTPVWIAFSCPYYVSRSRTQLKGFLLVQESYVFAFKNPKQEFTWFIRTDTKTVWN